jgi:prevent-host-death family protein
MRRTARPDDLDLVDLVHDLVHSAQVSTQVNIHEAKTHLSRLLERVQAGEEITIAKAGKPIARLSGIHERPARRVPGNDKIVIHPNFDDPLPEFDPDYIHPEDPMREILG